MKDVLEAFKKQAERAKAEHSEGMTARGGPSAA